MSTRLLRGRVLNFKAEPQGPEDTDAFEYFEDGALLIADGLIKAVGEHADLAAHRTC